MDVVKDPDNTITETFTHLVEKHQKTLLHISYMYLKDRTLAEDALQETFIKAYKALPKFRGECSEKTWLTRILINTCRDMNRSAWFRHTEKRVTPEELPIPAPPPDEEDAPALTPDEAEELRSALRANVAGGRADEGLQVLGSVTGKPVLAAAGIAGSGGAKPNSAWVTVIQGDLAVAVFLPGAGADPASVAAAFLEGLAG